MEPTPLRLPTLLLAAGASRRFGGPKLAALWQGRPMLSHVAATLREAGAAPLGVVVGAWADVYAPLAAPFADACWTHAAWADGMGASLAFGIRSLATLCPDAPAILVALADQGRVPASHFAALVSAHAAAPTRIIASAYDGTQGAPCVWPRAHWPTLAALTGDQGARAVLRQESAQVITLPCPEAALDFDVPTDFTPT